MNLMIEQLKMDKNKIPSPSRDQLMEMTMEAVKSASFDRKKAFKSLFLTNKLDGSEDGLMSDRISKLVGPQIVKFRNELMRKKGPQNLKELLKTITEPKGIKRKGIRPNIEGSELLDCDGQELDPMELLNELSAEENDDANVQNAHEVKETKETKFTSDNLVTLGDVCDNAEINEDGKFLDNFAELLSNSKSTSRKLLPLLSQLRHLNDNSRRDFKTRFTQYLSSHEQNDHSIDEPAEVEESEQMIGLDDIGTSEGVGTSEDVVTSEDIGTSEDIATVENIGTGAVRNDGKQVPKPRIGEYWKIRNGRHSLNVYVVAENPITVKYFDLSNKGNFLTLGERIFSVHQDDWDKKVSPPKVISSGKYRKFYSFDE